MKSFYKIQFYLLICIGLNATAQDLTITSSNALNVSSNTIVYLNGLELVPSANFQIGENTFSKSATAINAQSIERVFNFTNPINSYEGAVILHYEDSELNSIDENNLVLQVEDDSNIWSPYTSTVNTTDNTVAHTFASPISFLSVTASDGTTLETNEFDLTKIAVFPNPAVESVNISTNLNIETTLFDAKGKQILKTTEKFIDFSKLSTGLYLFVIKNQETQNLKTYKIIKR